jgi:hypothetical protein
MSAREEIIEQRNSLLSRLYACYPGPLQGEPLYRVMLGLFPEYSKKHCIRDLYYLREKGYVRSCAKPGGKTVAGPDASYDWKDLWWYLTAAGNEIAARLTEDPALEA